MKLDEETLKNEVRILNNKSQHNFILIYNDENYEINKFVKNYLNIINQKNPKRINIYTKDELFSNSKLHNKEQLLMLNKIFKVEDKDIPICIYVGDLKTNVCTIYNLSNMRCEFINRIFKNTITKLKVKDVLSIHNKSNDKCENIFNKYYSKYSNQKYQKLKGNKSIEYYLNTFIINRTLLDDIDSIYKEIELLYKRAKELKVKSNEEISVIKSNYINETDTFDESDQIFDKYNQEIIKINSLINDKQNLIEKKYMENSLIEINECKKKKYTILDKIKDWCISEDCEDKYEEIDEYEETDDIYIKSYKTGSRMIEKDYGIEERNLNLYNVNYKKFFEDKSVTMINTCQVTENLLRTQLNLESEDIDFSVCASGYWKALEIELNIIFIDTIRKSKGIIFEIPSRGISYKKGKYEVFSGYKYFNNNKIPHMVNINRVDKGKLCSCMLGELLHISQNYNNNELDKIIYGFYLMIEKDKSYPWVNSSKNKNIDYEISMFMNSIVNETRNVINRYRNKYSHTGVMTEEELFELKEILLKEDGLYHKIALLKKQVDVIK